MTLVTCDPMWIGDQGKLKLLQEAMLVALIGKGVEVPSDPPLAWWEGVTAF